MAVARRASRAEDARSLMVTDRTTELLVRWNGGDQAALQDLLDAHLSWVRGVVRGQLGERLRARLESGDVVQEAMLEFLRYGPRIKPRDGAQFRAIIGRIVINTLRDSSDWFLRKRRAMSSERPLSPESTVDLTLAAHSPQPDERAALLEIEERIRLVLELMPPQDRQILILREWDDLSFPEIGERLELSADAARMRYERALPRMRRGLRELRSGAVETLLLDAD